MRHLVTGAEMKLLDKNTIQFFDYSEEELIEQAANAFVNRFLHICGKHVKNGIVFCGTGNNGADGVAIARILNHEGLNVKVCKVAQWLKTKENVFEQDYDFVIDAIFGIGLSRDLSEEYIALVENINAMNALKFAVDMPSGINSDNGQVMGAAIKCDYTITFSFEKRGAYLWPGTEYVGKLLLEPIAITEKSWLDEKPSFVCLEEKDLYTLPKRPAHSNKGTFGKLLVIAGSNNMAGAAILAAKAALRCGVGLVKVLTTEQNRIILQTSLPEAIVSTYSEYDEVSLKNEMFWADAIVIGPGISRTKDAKRIVSYLYDNADVPMLWDADALNILSERESFLFHKDWVITPHLGEFSRLTNIPVEEIQKDLCLFATEFTKEHNGICVLKDFHTIIATNNGYHYMNLTGNNGMATAGSGDVLSGIIGALLAQGVLAEDAASYGVWVHGFAGDKAREKMGVHALIASDIIEELKSIWKKVDENAK